MSDERTDWNIHRNIAGLTLIGFCASRIFPKLKRWGVLSNLATIWLEIFLVFLAVLVAAWVSLARNKKTRAEVAWMTRSPWILRTAIGIAIAYLLGLFVEVVIVQVNHRHPRRVPGDTADLTTASRTPNLFVNQPPPILDSESPWDASSPCPASPARIPMPSPPH
jgi:hypothetical protein